MVGINGVGDLPGVSGPRAPVAKTRAAAAASAGRTDGVEISPQAAAAARAGAVSGQTEASAIRAERIERAKQSIEEGAYRLQEVVLQVAARIAPYVD